MDTLLPGRARAVKGLSRSWRLVRVVLSVVLAAAATTDPVIGAAGDVACDPAAGAYNGGNGTATDCVAKATAALLNGVDAVLPLGDEQYVCGGLSAFTHSYDSSWGPRKPISYPVPGNHEYQATGNADCSATATGYYTYFGSAAGDPAKGYYSYNLGAWHIVALNSELCFSGTGCGVGSPEESWLKSDLSASSAPCTLAYWHEPRFSSSPSGGITTFSAFWQDLYAGQADVVLNGHQHWCERFAQQSPAGQADLAGIREFIVGTGGAGLMSLSNRLPTSEASNDTAHGVLKMALHPGGYDWQFVPVAGSTFTDSGSTPCHRAGTGTVLPTTTIACNGTACATGWYGSAPVSVSLSATDSGGPGVARTVYTTDGTDPATSLTALTYVGPFLLPSSATVRFFSVDTAGKVEATRAQVIRVDTVAPSTAISCNNAPCAGTYNGSVSVTLPATDAGGSGVARTVYTTDGSEPATSTTATAYAGPFSVTQTSTVKASSVEAAGNAGPTATAQIQVSAGTLGYAALIDGRSSLLAHWRLGESSGTAAADTTGTYGGTYEGGATLGVPGAVAGDPDTAVGFNGSTGTVTVPALPTVGDLTVEGWSYLTGSSSTNNTVYGASGTVRVLARPGSPNSATTAYASVWLNGTEYALQPASTDSNLNTWVHWVLIRQGGVLTLYRDGFQVGQRTDLPATAPASLNGAIGRQTNGSYPLTGRIDEVALYRGALSATDVANDYQTALGKPPAPVPPPASSYKSVVLGESGLLSYWRLGESGGTAAVDSKGRNNGTYSAVSFGAGGAITNDPDTAISCNGSTSTVSLPALSPVGDFTVEGWTYLTNGSTTNNTLYGSYGAVRLLARPGTVTAAYAGVWLNGTEYVLQPNSTASNLNTWVYWTLTRKGNTLTLYRDGAQIGQRTDLPATAAANISGWVGAQGGSTYFLTGRVDDVAVYGAALDATAVAGHYTAAQSGPAPS